MANSTDPNDSNNLSDVINDEDGDNCYQSVSEDEDVSNVNELVNKCLNMKPKMRTDSTQNKVGKRKLKAIFARNTAENTAKIGAVTRKQSKSISSSGTVRDSVEGLYKDMQADFTALQTHVSSVNKRIDDVFDILRNLSDRVDSLEGQDDDRSSQILDLESRLMKQEYLNSEFERKSRANQIILTHPDINANSANLNNLIQKFIQHKFEVPQAKLKGLIARKIGPNIHSVHVKFPRDEIIGELFKIKKELRSENKDADLFLNEFLTPYNYNLLKTLKEIKAACIKKKLPMIIYSAFNFQGRLYAKVSKDADRILIRDKFDISNLVAS